MPEQAHAVVERVRRFALPACGSAWRGSFLRQSGEMRFGPDRPWMPFEAQQTFGAGMDFRWEARVRMAPFLTAHVTDAFEQGEGRLVARVLGVIPVARARGPDTDVAEAMRGLAELPWRPFAWAADAVILDALSPDRLRATFDDGRTRATVEFLVGEDGRILAASTPSRPRMVGNEVVPTAWSGSFSDYRELDGARVPTAAEVSWDTPQGSFTYWRGRVVDFRLVR